MLTAEPSSHNIATEVSEDNGGPDCTDTNLSTVRVNTNSSRATLIKTTFHSIAKSYFPSPLLSERPPAMAKATASWPWMELFFPLCMEERKAHASMHFFSSS